MTDELTMFGKVMEHTIDGQYESWCGGSKRNVWVSVYNIHNGIASDYDWSFGDLACSGTFSTKEAARDDAEATLVALYEELGAVVEPWITDRDPSPPANATCDDSYIVTWRSEYGDLTGEAHWDGTTWYGDGQTLLHKPYAWRPMPKAPRREPL